MMVQWLRLASLLPCTLALRASEPPHHARRVAIIGKSTFLEDGYAGTESQQVQVQVASMPREWGVAGEFVAQA